MTRYAYWLMTLLMLLVTSPTRAGTVTYIHTDAQGTPVMESDAQGHITARFEYTPYGVPVTSMGAAPDGVGYTGHVNDPESGLVYMQARYYDAGTGHMLSVDPVGPAPGDVFGFNRYAYANNNPARFTDPDGRKCSTVDGKDSCTFDEFKDKSGKSVSREKALSSGNWLSKIVHADRGSRILRAEAGMTAKYSAAKNLAAKGGEVTIKGSEKLGISSQSISGKAIVSRMEHMRSISYAGASRDNRPGYTVRGGVPPTGDGSPSDGPMRVFSDGSGVDVSRLFGHEILHTLYSGIELPNRGWANPDYQEEHQQPFDEASDAIK